MDHSHGVTVARLGARAARLALLGSIASVAMLSVVPAWESHAAAADPQALAASASDGTQPVALASVEQPQTSARSQRLPALEETLTRIDGVADAAPAVATAHYVLPNEALIAGRQVSYVASEPSQSSARQWSSSLNPNQNEPLFRFTGMQPPEVPPEVNSEEAPAEAGANAAGASGTNNQQVYGQAPPNSTMQFLRDIDVLLAPGAWQADTGFVYTHFSNDFPILIRDEFGDILDTREAEVRRRLLYTPLAVRYGFTENVQLYAALPVGFSNTQTSTLGISETENISGLGDLNFGASIHLLDGEGQMPDVIGTIGFTAPTGKFDAPLFGLVPGSNLGQGYWAYNAQLLFIHRYDPVILFYGGGYRHLWERTFNGEMIAPGEQANYMLGVGFSVNDRVTLSTTFQGFYITSTAINGEYVRGSNLEPMSMRFAATIVRDCRIIEPFVQIGVTESAPQANAGVVVTFY